jgi:hypothetical protein
MPATDSAVEADFDWFSPGVIRDPQKYDGMIREAGPVVYSPEYDVWATGEPEVTTNMAVHGHERLPLRIVPA